MRGNRFYHSGWDKLTKPIRPGADLRRRRQPHFRRAAQLHLGRREPAGRHHLIRGNRARRPLSAMTASAAAPPSQARPPAAAARSRPRTSGAARASARRAIPAMRSPVNILPRASMCRARRRSPIITARTRSARCAASSPVRVAHRLTALVQSVAPKPRPIVGLAIQPFFIPELLRLSADAGTKRRPSRAAHVGSF